MKRYVFYLSVSSFVFVVTLTSLFAAPLYNPSTGHWYDIVQGDWFVAENAAVNLGGHLVTINNQAEQDWLVANIAGINGIPWYWMGFNDIAVEGTWVWISGEPVTYTHWWPGEPNNYNGIEDWGIMNYGSPGISTYWNDQPLYATNFGIAEYPTNPVPEPTTMLLLGSGLVGLAGYGRKKFFKK